MKMPYLLPLLTCVIGLSLTISIYSMYRDFESKKNLQVILSNNRTLLSNIEINLNKNILLLNTLKTFFDASTEVSRKDFSVFSRAILEISPAIQAVEWVPKVLYEERGLYQQKAIEDGFSDFDIIEPAPGGGFMPSGQRDVYYPVYYVEPFVGNEIVLGLDPPDHKIRIDAILRATETGRAAATSPLTLTQETQMPQKSILLFTPVYEGGILPETVLERENKLEGLVLMALRVSDIVNYTLSVSNIDHGVSITDVDSKQKIDGLLYKSSERTVGEIYATTDIIDMAGRKWEVSVYPKKIRGAGFSEHISWVILFTGAGLTLFLTFAIFQLIYRRKLIENLVRDRTREVQELSTAMEKTVEGVSVFNEDNEFTYVNESYAALCGYAPSELIGRHWGCTIYEEDKETMLHACKQALDDAKVALDLHVASRTGALLNVRISLVKKVDEDNNFVGYYCFMSDVTKRRQAEINLKKANEELEEFAYRTSHDLRSPLISSIGLLNLVKSSIKSEKYDVALESVGHICESLEKLDTLVDEILTLTKIKYIEEEEVDVNISELVDDSLKNVSHLPNFDRLTIEQSYDFDGLLKTKKSRIKLIVENLISNAIKYQDKSKRNSFVKISVYLKGKAVVFEVSDNGLGIPEEFREKLFKMFQRFHPHESYGSGLGLYMMRKSADLIDGEIVVKHKAQGTVFQLVVPINEGEKIWQ